LASKHGHEVKCFRIGKEIDVTLLKNLIILIDGYQVNYFGDPAPFEKPIRAGKLGREISVEWKMIQRSLMRIATTVKAIPRIGSLLIIQSLMRSLSIAVSMGAILLPLIGTPPAFLESPLLFTFMLILIASGMLVTSKFAGREVAKRIEAYFHEHKQKYRFVRQYLKQTAQKLLYTLSHYLKTTGEKPSDHVMKLYRADYDGIKILKKPKWFRRRYVVVVELTE